MNDPNRGLWKGAVGSWICLPVHAHAMGAAR